jgi:hypothetical protein
MIHRSLVDPCPNDIRGQISWCSKAVCKECHFEWYVCRLCPNICQIIDTQRKFSGHRYKFHRQSHTLAKTSRTTSVGNNVPKKRKTTIASKITLTSSNPQTTSPVSSPLTNATSVGSSILFSTPIQNKYANPTENDNNNTPSLTYGGLPSEVSNCIFCRDKSKEYYANNYHRKYRLSYLVSESFYSGNKAPKDISKDDLEMFMSLTLLVKQMSTNNCDVLGNFLERLFRRLDLIDLWTRTHMQHLETISKYCSNCCCQGCVFFWCNSIVA